MTKYRNLERIAYEELRAHLDEHPLREPLQQYIHERFSEAGEDSRERMRVMMEIIRFEVFLQTLPEYQALREYVDRMSAPDVIKKKKAA